MEDIELPVIRVYQGDGEGKELNTTIKMTDILCFQYDRPDIIIHTLEGTFRPPKGVMEWLYFFKEFGFTKLGRDVVADLSKVVKYDPKNSKAYFENGVSVTVNESNVHLLDFLYN